ncbi:MAG: Gfo/Idh/MocA family oxidoreductase [Spirochaetota bacterium]
MIHAAVIGFGYWGPNLVRNFSRVEGCTVKTVVDANETRRANVKRLYPQMNVIASADEVLADASIDAVVIATPVSTHFELAQKALMSGKHVLVEKPMTSSASHARKLIDLAKEQKRTLMVDHTFLYTGAVRKMKELIAKGDIGDIQYFDSVRINLGLFQHDVNVIWDLAPHDLSILHYLIGEEPEKVSARGMSHLNNGIENIAYLYLSFPSRKIAHFNCSWTSPVKIRRILIGGTKKMIEFDDLAPTEKVKIYDTGYRVVSKEDESRVLVDYRVGDIYIPKIDQSEALFGVATDFVNAIRNGSTPVADGESGFFVARILEAAEKSIKNNGMEVVL